MLPHRYNLFVNCLLIVLTILLINNVDHSLGMKKKMFRKLKSMFSSKAKKLIILPIPIPLMMDDKKFGNFGLMGGGLGSLLTGQMDPWMVMSMMDCPEMMTMPDGHHTDGQIKKPINGHQDKTYITGPGSFTSIPSSQPSPSPGHHYGSSQETRQTLDNSWSNQNTKGTNNIYSGYRSGRVGGSGQTKSPQPATLPNYFKGQTRKVSPSSSGY